MPCAKCSSYFSTSNKNKLMPTNIAAYDKMHYTVTKSRLQCEQDITQGLQLI